MTMLRRTLPVDVEILGERQVRIRMMTGGLKGDGYDLPPWNCLLDRYLSNPIQLWQHNPEFPVGSNDEIALDGTGITARVNFAPAGISAKADEVCGLVKAGVVRACSVGFDVLQSEPIDPKDPRAGRRALRWELLECSFVSVPLDTDAAVTARAQQGRADMADWKCGAGRDYPIQDGDPAWDGAAAEKAIFDWAGGDEFDAAKARRCFLAYDAAAPDQRGSYKLPFVNIVDGEPKVPKSALRAASGAHGVQAADIGDAKEAAQAVLDHYKEKAGVGEDGERRRSRRRRPERAKIRGMWQVGQLAYVVGDLAWAKDMAEWEKSIEGDDSKVPEMLAAALQQVGEALVAMTAEEVAELLAGEDDDDGDLLLADGERAEISAAATAGLRNFRRGYFRARAVAMASRAGAALSAANAAKIAEADGHHEKALEHHRAAEDCRGTLGECHGGMRAAHEKMRDACDAMGDELDGEMPDGEVLRKHHRTLARHLNAVSDHLDEAADEHEALGDAHRGMARSVRAARRCLRAVDGYDADGQGAQGSNSTVQKSDGVAQDEGSRSADFRRRQAEKLHLVGA